MKKIMWGLLAGFLLIPSVGRAAYVEVQGGLGGEAYGIRGGTQSQHWDFSLGYLKDTEDDADFHTLGGELYFVFPVKAVELRLGGGLGYTMVTMPDGVSKTADNSGSYIAGVGVRYALSSNWSIVGMAKERYFETDTYTTTFGSHEETLSNGQEVEVLDESHSDQSEVFRNFRATIALRYTF